MLAYAPMLDSMIPAFTLKTENNKTCPDEITVKFRHNVAVGMGQVKGFHLILKSLETTSGRNTVRCSMSYWQDDSTEHNTSEKWASFVQKGEITFWNTDSSHYVNYINSNAVEAGEFYKLQLAYITGGTKRQPQVGSYSTIGIARCIGAKPTVEVEGLMRYSPTDPTKLYTNSDSRIYMGKYVAASRASSTEVVYRYRFDLKDEAENILETSGWQFPLHDDDRTMSFSHRRIIPTGETYYLYFTVNTVNNYSETVKYAIGHQVPITPMNSHLKLCAAQTTPESRECGYVEVFFKDTLTRLNKVTMGLFRQEVGSTNWDELTTFDLKSTSDLNNFSWRDFSVAHGAKYIYCVREKGTDVRGKVTWSDPILSTDSLAVGDLEREPVTVEFEHMYLGDAQHQLKISLNPKVTSFKETLLEQKLDTIGGKYPYFFRNGDLRYREIAISGLISYQMDSEGYFMGYNVAERKTSTAIKNAMKEQLGFDGSKHVANTNLTNANFASERKFKEKVLEWLNNGQPKLFRSAAEGNCVVRLMNVSLSPNEQLGRMLHTFSATGYEILDCDNMLEMLNNNVVAFPKFYVNTSEARTRTSVYNQIISAQSIMMETPVASRTRLRSATQNYARVIKQPKAIRFVFTMPTVSSALTVYTEDVNFLPQEVTAGYITLVGEILNGKLVIPAHEVPESFGVNINDCTHIQQIEETDGTDDIDTFSQLARSVNQYLIPIPIGQTCSTKDTDLLYDQSIVRLISATAIPLVSEEYPETPWLDFYFADSTVKRIYFEEDNPRVFANIDWLERIEKSSNLDLTIHALIKPNASSALDAFILDISTLGGVY